MKWQYDQTNNNVVHNGHHIMTEVIECIKEWVSSCESYPYSKGFKINFQVVKAMFDMNRDNIPRVIIFRA